ncbi:hypothetical protein TNCV_2083491 [Trichonephila clavipes]|nr:hypothetical protein TNCV_2083491 [Trichonephila clavipes]
MCRAAAEFVPMLRSAEQKEIHFSITQGLLDTINSEPGFWLCSEMKIQLKGSRFQSSDEIMQNATVELSTFPREAF